MPSPSDRRNHGSGAARSGTDRFADDVLELVAVVPSGRVIAYGDIAACLGSRAARRVGQVMARYGSSVPWWRVVHADGSPPVCHDGRARECYEQEETPLRLGVGPCGYRVDMARARWTP